MAGDAAAAGSPADAPAAVDAKPRRRPWVNWGKVGPFIVDNYLPLAFLVAIVWAMAWPAPGKAVVSVTVLDGSVHIIQEINIILVFLVSGLILKTDDIKTALRYKLGCVYGFVSILFITPCLGFALRAIPLQPSDFAAGLTLFAAVPTTLGIGVSLVRSCKGNDGLALLLTVGTNMLGIVTMPLWMKALFHDSDLDVHVDVLNLFVKLLITIFVPSVIGKAIREIFKPAVPRFTTKYKTALSMFATTMLAMIVWQTLSGAQSTLIHQPFVNIVYVILLAIAQHLVYLAFNFTAVYLLRMPLPELIATGIMASQKSAPVAVTVISYLTSDVTQQGLLAIPAVVGQISQIFIGAAIAPVMARRVKRWKAAQADNASAAAAAAGGGGGGEAATGAAGATGAGAALENGEGGDELDDGKAGGGALKADSAGSLEEGVGAGAELPADLEAGGAAAAAAAAAPHTKAA